MHILKYQSKLLIIVVKQAVSKLIGILINTREFTRIDKNIETFENLEFYKKFSSLYQIPIVFYTIKGIYSNSNKAIALVVSPFLFAVK